MASGHGVDKPNQAWHPNRQVHAERFAASHDEAIQRASGGRYGRGDPSQEDFGEVGMSQSHIEWMNRDPSHMGWDSPQEPAAWDAGFTEADYEAHRALVRRK